MPAGRSRREMCAVEIVILVAGAAFFRGHSVTVWTSPHIHGVLVSIIALPRKIPSGVTIHAARVP